MHNVLGNIKYQRLYLRGYCEKVLLVQKYKVLKTENIR